MTAPKTAERNRGIYHAFEAGGSVAQLAARYGLSRQHVAAILTAERYKREVSPEPVYRELRFGLSRR